MSAQALLSLTAPIAPPAPQGAATADASGFDGMLRGLLKDGAATTEDVSARPVDKDGDTAAAPGFLSAPVPPSLTPTFTLVAGPTPETLPADAGQATDYVAPPAPPLPSGTPVPTAVAASPGAAPALNAAESVETAASQVIAPPAIQPTPTHVRDAAPAANAADPAKVPVPPVAPAPPSTTPIADGDAASTPSTPPAAAKDALIAASQTATPGAAPVSVDKATPTAPAVSLDKAAAEAASPIPTVPASATPTSAPTPAPVTTTPPPRPLRPLAERTAKADGGAAVVAASTDAARGASTSVAVSPVEAVTLSDQPVKPVEAVAPVVSDPAAPTDDSAPPSAPEVSTSQATPQTAREVSLSTLSRAAIDATTQIAAQILRKLEGRSTSFEMALTPDDLGRVDVKLDIDSEGRLAARLAFDNPAAATDLRGRADELRRQLEAQGFHMAEDAFEFTQRDSGSHAFDRGQDSRGGHARFSAAARLNAETDAAPPVWTALSLSPSGVDMKV